MIQAFYTAASGMNAQQKNIEVIAHNISNVNTPGHRIKRAEFSELLSREINANEENGVLNTGYGVKVSSISTMPLPDHVNPFGIAVGGEGYFVIEDFQGFRSYTKNGNFGPVLANDGNYYLGTEDGNYVLDRNSNMIEVSQDPDMFVVSAGQLYTQGHRGEEPITPVIVRFDSDAELHILSNGNVSSSKDSGEPRIATTSFVTANYLDELSELVIANNLNEMTRLMQTQMAYNVNSKMLQTADEMRGMANRLRY